MLKIFLSSHGHFASGIKSSLDILLGNSKNITVFDAYVDESSVQEHLDAFFSEVSEEDQVLLLSDLYGGSVNSVMYTYLTHPNTYLVAGVNLACVLEFSVQTEINEEIIHSVVEQSRQMMMQVKYDDVAEEQEDFF